MKTKTLNVSELKDTIKNLQCQNCFSEFYHDRIITKLIDGILVPFHKNHKKIVCGECGGIVLKKELDFNVNDVPAIGDHSTKNAYNKQR